MSKTGYGKSIPIPSQEFPDYKYRPFPRMMLEKVDEAYIKSWRERNSYIDERTGKICYTAAAPRLGTMREMIATQEDVEAGYATVVGQPVIVQSAEDERQVMAAKGLASAPAKPKMVEMPIAGMVGDYDDNNETVKLRAENARLRQQAADRENADKQPAPAAEVPRTKRKYTRRAAPTKRVAEIT